jgi:hypothetical protein
LGGLAENGTLHMAGFSTLVNGVPQPKLLISLPSSADVASVSGNIFSTEAPPFSQA